MDLHYDSLFLLVVKKVVIDILKSLGPPRYLKQNLVIGLTRPRWLIRLKTNDIATASN